MDNIYQFIDNNAIDIDKKFIDLFWNSIENNEWICIDNKIISYIEDNIIINKTDHEWFNIKYSKENILLWIKSTKYKFKKDYIYYNINKEIDHDYILIKGDVFKDLLISFNNDQVITIKNKYILLEKTYIEYLKYINKYERNKNKLLENYNINRTPLIEQEYIYIATDAIHERDNIYKIGRTIKLSNRLYTYNTRSVASQDKFEYKYTLKCLNSKAIEALIFSYLNNFIINKEFVKMNLNDLYNIINDIIQTNKNIIIKINKYINTVQSDVINNYVSSDDKKSYSEININIINNDDNIINPFNKYKYN